MSALPNLIVLDTNLIVSAIILPQGVAAQALAIAFDYFEPVYSRETLRELADVLSRPKFDPYAERETRRLLVTDYAEAAREVTVTIQVTDCVDPKDNKFLALAVDAGARLLVTGDKKHLLAMHPYRDVSIIGLREFIETHKAYIR